VTARRCSLCSRENRRVELVMDGARLGRRGLWT
jgi:hypothetical protein